MVPGAPGWRPTRKPPPAHEAAVPPASGRPASPPTERASLAIVRPMGDRLGMVSWILLDDHSAPAGDLLTVRRDCTGHS